MVVRAFDFLPVVDVTFGDVVRAIVTADRSLYPQDEAQLRATLVESLRRRGIYPARIASLADEALTWSTPPAPLVLPPSVNLSTLIHSATQDLDPTSAAGPVRSDADADLPEGSPSVTAAGGTEQFAPDLTAWAQGHAIELGLDPCATTSLSGLHVVYPRAADGQPRPQIVLQFLQRRHDLEVLTIPEQLRVPIRAGATLITRVDGTVDRLVAKPLPLSESGRAHRLARRTPIHRTKPPQGRHRATRRNPVLDR